MRSSSRRTKDQSLHTLAVDQHHQHLLNQRLSFLRIQPPQRRQRPDALARFLSSFNSGAHSSAGVSKPHPSPLPASSSPARTRCPPVAQSMSSPTRLPRATCKSKLPPPSPPHSPLHPFKRTSAPKPSRSSMPLPPPRRFNAPIPMVTLTMHLFPSRGPAVTAKMPRRPSRRRSRPPKKRGGGRWIVFPGWAWIPELASMSLVSSPALLLEAESESFPNPPFRQPRARRNARLPCALLRNPLRQALRAHSHSIATRGPPWPWRRTLTPKDPVLAGHEFDQRHIAPLLAFHHLH